MRMTRCNVILLVLILHSVSAASCISNEDCQGLQYCEISTQQCSNLPLSSNWSWQLGVVTVISTLAAILSAAAGLGGGGIFVPIFILVMGMSPQQAVPLSSSTIFAGSIINMVFNVRSKHILIPSHPLIDYNALVVMTPLLLVGTILGVILNTLLPSWSIVIMLLMTTSLSTWKTCKKAVKSWRQESALFKQLESSHPKNQVSFDHQNTGVDNVPLDCQNTGADHSVQSEDHRHHNEHVSEHFDEIVSIPSKYEEDKSSELKKLLQKEKRPFMQVIATTFLWIAVVLFSLFRGGKSSKSILGFRFCSKEYWGVTSGQFVFLLLSSIVVVVQLRKHYESKVSLGWTPSIGEITWTKRNTTIFPMFSFVAGVLGGLLGIGGGMVLGPVMLELGTESRSTSATSATAVFITSSLASIQYLILNLLMLDYSLWFFCWAFVGTFIGQTLVDYLIKKFHRTSFIIFSISAMITMATIMMTVSGVLTVMKDIKQGTVGLATFC